MYRVLVNSILQVIDDKFLVYMHMRNSIIFKKNINDILKQNGWRGLAGLTVMIFKTKTSIVE